MSPILSSITRNSTLLSTIAILMALLAFVANYVPLKAAVQHGDVTTIAGIICTVLIMPMFILGIRHSDKGAYITALSVVALGSAHYRITTIETSLDGLVVASLILTTGAFVGLFVFDKGPKQGLDIAHTKD